jgi:hypothetical protein
MPSAGWWLNERKQEIARLIDGSLLRPPNSQQRGPVKETPDRSLSPCAVIRLGIADWDLKPSGPVIENTIRPSLSVEEASLARRVTVVGGTQGFQQRAWRCSSRRAASWTPLAKVGKSTSVYPMMSASHPATALPGELELACTMFATNPHRKCTLMSDHDQDSILTKTIQ